MAYRARCKLVAGEPDEARLEGERRAFDAVVLLYREHHPSVDVDEARAAVLSAIA